MIRNETNLSELARDMRFVSGFAVWMASVHRSTGMPEEGCFENDAEHAYSLAKVALFVAWKYFPELDDGKIAIYCNIHDDLEGYDGDTPTLGATAEQIQAKYAAEERAMIQMRQDFSDHPKYLEHLNAYEQQVEPEARYVRMLDKSMPSLLNLLNGGWSLRQQHNIDTPEELRRQYDDTVARFISEEYGDDWQVLIEVRNVLTDMMAHELFN